MKMMLHNLKQKLLLVKNKIEWRKANNHNCTSIKTNVPANIAQIGNYTYGRLNIHYYNTDIEHLSIGNYCSIADNVHFFLAGEHDYKNLLTFPFKNRLSQYKINESTSKGPIVIDDDVWIGYGAIILSGVHIGQGAVIGAGSIVAKDVPPYAIYAANRIISKRFSDEITEKLMKVDYSKLMLHSVNENVDLFYKHITSENIDDILRCLENITRKE